LNATDETAIARPQMRRVRRLVVKIGSNVLTTRQHKPNRPVIRQLVKDIVELRGRGIEVAIVTSGAVAAGMGRLELKQRPEQIAELQALAAIGQNLMMNSYKTLFRRHNVPVGQVLLTAEDILDNRRRYVNLENTFRSLFAYGAVPVINENDSVAVAELRRQLGENDMLAAYVSNLIRADLLVIMSDVEGLYTSFGPNGPEGELLHEVRHNDDQLEKMASGSFSGVGSGGMLTKLRAARLLMTCGEMTLIAHGRNHRLLDIMDGQLLGTLFSPERKRLGSRKRWIAFASQCRGRIVVDCGAQRAIAQQYRSLLPAGVIACEGDFSNGEVVCIDSERGEELGRGLSRYSSEELCRIFGKSSPAVEKELGRPALEVIHRDDLVLF
jgi:glutamate 5-kinase